MPDSETVTHTRRARALALVSAVLALSLLHHVIPLSYLHWHNVLQHLYYVPITIAALLFGWRGGVAIAALAGVSHAPHIVLAWSVAPFYAFDQLSDIGLFAFTGGLVGVLTERERKQRLKLEETTRQLDQVYRELQNNFEQMKRAERLYAVGQLSAGLAHEIRNPLAGIMGAVALLRRDTQPESRRLECLEIVDRECRRLNRLLTGFLDFARPRTPRFERVGVASIVNSVVELAQHTGGRNGVVIRTEMTRTAQDIDCDPDQIRQLVLNLVMNAIQASRDPGEIVISVDGSEEGISIAVSDQGAGVPADLRDQIFDPFFTTREGGTGLGLSVAHQIVAQHGGTIVAESNPDCGMTFRVRLPVLQPQLS